MQCLTCKSQMQTQEVAKGLLSAVCTACAGVWLDLRVYQRWIAARQSALTPSQLNDAASTQVLASEVEPEPLEPVTEATPQALRCPQCQNLLQKYRIASQQAFRVDRCAPCHQVWFDAPEWRSLNEQGLLTSLTAILSDRGQRDIRAAETRERLAQMYQQRFGAADYAQAAAVREWLAQHPQRRHILAYLSAPDPYAAPAN
ncbi:zf-TFIIB domain-containing protein [Chitinibacter sp. FCG-7]|uniref:Zf-TFIIB domain-containing protein n=1 Tax=Chitinibacter mangrovi TaxID=3153927 RepID=A0AAU7FAZ3_9NEIS